MIVTRWKMYGGSMIRDEAGPYVRFEDYDGLAAKSERQAAVIERQATQLEGGGVMVDHYIPTSGSGNNP